MGKRRLEFSLWDSEDVQGSSVCQITTASLNIHAREGSLIDPRLGPLHSGEICTTCHQNLEVCVGHFAYIDLGTHCFHPLFLNEAWNKIKNRCFHCRTECTARQCVGCGLRMGKWKREQRKRSQCFVRDHITYTTKEEQLVVCPNDVARLLGDDKNMLLRHMPVLPVCARPTVSQRGDRPAFHALTQLYSSVTREALLMNTFQRTHCPDHIKKSQWARLQDAVYEVYDTSKSQREGGLRQRLDGKVGRFRSNLLGKRVDFSARTVITADPTLDLDQVGVPISIAKRLTKPIGVTDFNITQCREMVRLGPDIIGGAVYVTRRADGSRWDLEFITGSLNNLSRQLCVGDVVERTLINDDWVVINRQPSLHKVRLILLKSNPLQLLVESQVAIAHTT